MSRKQPDLTLNALRLPLAAGGQIEQTDERFGGFSAMRLGLGAMVHQEVWRKTRSTITATGLVPPGLDGIDWTAPITVGWVKPRSIQAAGNVIAIPAARRTDAAPFGFSIDANGFLRPVSVSMATDTATLGTVAGAIGYQVLWYPLMSMRAPAGPTLRFDAFGAVAGWELTAEEV